MVALDRVNRQTAGAATKHMALGELSFHRQTAKTKDNNTLHPVCMGRLEAGGRKLSDPEVTHKLGPAVR
jgi:hypothetical protein